MLEGCFFWTKNQTLDNIHLTQKQTVHSGQRHNTYKPTQLTNQKMTEPVGVPSQCPCRTFHVKLFICFGALGLVKSRL